MLAAAGLSLQCNAGDNIPVLEPDAFIASAKADKKAVIIDVRTPKEYAEGHIAGARLIDYLDTAAFDKTVGKLSARKHYYVYCRSGRRSHDAAVKMRKRGLTVTDMKGGFISWQDKGLPVEKKP